MSLLVEIERYLDRTGIAPTTFGRRVVNDPRFVLDLRRGRSPTPATARRITAILSSRGQR
jgi:hypothetical protein